MTRTFGQSLSELRNLEEAQRGSQPNGPTDKYASSFRPLPVNALPHPLRGFVDQVAVSVGCDSSYAALGALTVTASAIGNSRTLHLKDGWEAPSILWGVIVGESGTAKTPVFQHLLAPLRALDLKESQKAAEERAAHELDLAIYDADFQQWKKSKDRKEDLRPKAPMRPAEVRHLVDDTTPEALAPILKENPRGVLLARDELSGWFGSFGRYSGNESAEAAQWLPTHSGQCWQVDRKTGEPRRICVPRASVSILGGIQPGILRLALGQQHCESGMAARFLFVYPPRRAKEWTEEGVDPAAQKEWARLVEALVGFKLAEGEDGELRPVSLSLTEEAKGLWVAFYNKHNQEQKTLSGALAAAGSKLEEHPARLALVIHCIRVAAGDRTVADANSVDAVSMTSGIALTEWFKTEAKRIYEMLGETESERSQSQLIEFIQRQGGSVTVRQVQQGYRELKGPGAALAGLKQLVGEGLGYWEPSPSGKPGQPTRYFVLHEAVYDSPAESEVFEGMVDVDDLPEWLALDVDDEGGAV